MFNFGILSSKTGAEHRLSNMQSGLLSSCKNKLANKPTLIKCWCWKRYRVITSLCYFSQHVSFISESKRERWLPDKQKSWWGEILASLRQATAQPCEPICEPWNVPVTWGGHWFQCPLTCFLAKTVVPSLFMLLRCLLFSGVYEAYDF